MAGANARDHQRERVRTSSGPSAGLQDSREESAGHDYRIDGGVQIRFKLSLAPVQEDSLRSVRLPAMVSLATELAGRSGQLSR